MPFHALGLHPSLVQATREMKYAQPTPIQEQAIPAILSGRDLIGTAQTGTGKTAAFLLPILHQLLELPLGLTRALVVTPTRELAQQIDDVLLGLAYHTPIRAGLMVGGADMSPQERALRSGAEIIIATPGRLLDHMRLNQPRFDHVQILVLDEADRMLDMGFLPDIRRIVGRLPARRQTLMFSATMPPVIAKLAHEILREPLTIEIGRRSTPAVGITQAAYPVPEAQKATLLRYLLRHTEMPSVLVFTRTKLAARRLARIIAADGFSVAELHSNLTQPERNKAMEGFRRGEFQVLVATNIAARGLDVDHITHVISFDVPAVPEDYVHRIGRTARAEATGDAFVLVSPAEERHLARIERQIGQRLPRVTLPDFDYEAPTPGRERVLEGHGRGAGRGAGRGGGRRGGGSRGGRTGGERHRGERRPQDRRPAETTAAGPAADGQTGNGVPRKRRRRRRRGGERDGQGGADRPTDRSGNRGDGHPAPPTND
jgi:ATP-dependent RNA helicase RhlE